MFFPSSLCVHTQGLPRARTKAVLGPKTGTVSLQLFLQDTVHLQWCVSRACAKEPTHQTRSFQAPERAGCRDPLVVFVWTVDLPAPFPLLEMSVTICWGSQQGRRFSSWSFGRFLFSAESWSLQDKEVAFVPNCFLIRTNGGKIWAWYVLLHDSLFSKMQALGKTKIIESLLIISCSHQTELLAVSHFPSSGREERHASALSTQSKFTPLFHDPLLSHQSEVIYSSSTIP